MSDSDRITVDGKPLAAPEPPRLWLYHKPRGLVTSARDEKGRKTVFDALPGTLPRVMPVGRLDLNSEGLLLLTNDGGVKRRLELPSTGWLRRYRVRAKGAPTEAMLGPLRAGLTVDGEAFQPMTVTVDRQQGANAWADGGAARGAEPRNPPGDGRGGAGGESPDPYRLWPVQAGHAETGEVEEVRPRVVRDQLGQPGWGPETGKSRTPKAHKSRKPPDL